MKLMVILSRVPWPLEKGDKLRAYHMIRHLSLHFEIILCALNDEGPKKEAYAHLRPYCHSIHFIPLRKPAIYLRLLGGLFFRQIPFQVQYFLSKNARKQVRGLVRKHQPDRILCQLIRTAEYVRECTDIPCVLDYMDVFSKGMDRRIRTAPFYMKPFVNLEYRRLLTYEHQVFSRFRERMIISGQDRDLIVHPQQRMIHVIPNGVDTDFFQPQLAVKDFDLLFNGNMSYPPNVESAEFLVKNILPLVHKEMPGVRLLISGANPSARVKALESEHVKISGWVEDIRTSFARSRVLVAPMQISIGLQNKLLEAMAMKVPCVTSPLANNALEAPEGTCILVASQPEEYARHLVFLLKNPEKAEAMANNALAFVRQHFQWQAVCSRVGEILRMAGNHSS